jgi:hypothetical protein
MQDANSNEELESADPLTVVLTFSQMLSSGRDADATRFAAEHGWLDKEGQPTEAGRQLSRALLQQRGTRSVFRLW